MHPFGIVAVYFSGTLFSFLLFWSWFSVYVLGQFERAWGQGGSFQVLCGLTFGASFLALLSSGIGARLAQPQAKVAPLKACAGALLFIALSTLLGWLISRLGISGANFIALAWFILAPAIIGFALIKRFGRATHEG